jgi:hypothetical protein
MTGSKVMGVCQRLDNCLENLSKDLNRHKNKLRELLVQQKETEKELNGGNPYDEEVESLIRKLKTIDEKLMEDTAA